jgi:hypothetical protein
MATLVINESRPANASSTCLRRWLDGHWALLFSDAIHFAPDESTPKGYLVALASVLADNGIKLLEVQSSGSATHSWIDESDPHRATLTLNAADSRSVLDLHAHTLAKRIRETAGPFVIVLDERAQCRATLKYRRENILRPRTLEDIVETIYVLRGDDHLELESDRRPATQRTRSARRKTQGIRSH